MAGEPGPADPYQVLGVTADATREEIVRAYRQLVRGSHPDVRRGDPAAPERFRAVTGAYQLLVDPARRTRYDRAHPRSGPGLASGAGRAGSAGPIRPRPGPAPIWAGPVHVDPPQGQPRHHGPPPAAPPGWPWWLGQEEMDVAPVRWVMWYRAGQDDGSWWA
jgi:DnaJ domain